MTNYILALILGTFFGFSLNKAGLTRYSKIVNVFRFTDLTVLKFMMTALVVAMSGLYTLRAFGWITFPNVPSTYIAGNLIGGLLFAWAWLSPDSVRALSPRERRRQARLSDPWKFGFLTGAAIFGLTYQQVFPQIQAIANVGRRGHP